MKKGFQAAIATMFFVALLMFCFITAASAQNGLTKIADGVYSYIDEKNPSPMTGFGANAGIVVGKDGILVVDTLISAKMAQQFIKDIRAVSDKPIRYVINTHDHLDHVLGNSEFAKLGAIIIAHRDAKAALIKNGNGLLERGKKYGLTDEFMEGTVVVPPSLTFTDEMELDLGDKKVQLLNAGPSHTSGSILVYVPDTKTLFTGDILFTGYHPNIANGDMKGWIKALDKMASLDTVRIIPGHGPVSAKKDLADMKNYLIVFDAKAKALVAKKKEADFIAAEIKKALPERKFFDMFILSGVKALYFKPQ